MLALAFFLASCGNDKQKNLSVALQTISVDTTATSKDGHYKGHVHADLQILQGEKYAALNDSIIKSGILQPDFYGFYYDRLPIKQMLLAFMRRWVDNYQSITKELYSQDKDILATEKVAPLNWKYILKTSVIPGEDDNIVYLANITTFTGGSSVMNYTRAYNIHLKDGKILHLQDVFSKRELKNLPEKIIEQLAEDIEAEDTLDVKRKGFFTGINSYATDNFILTDDSITFIYTPGEISNKQIKISLER
jgi:hypothetical protein